MNTQDTPLQPITTLELPTRLEIALYRAGLKTVGCVVALTPHQLGALPNVGKKSMVHLMASLKARDLSLAGARTEEKPPKIEVTTPPQVGAPATGGVGGSALQSRRHTTSYTHYLPLYAIYSPFPDAYMAWEIVGRETQRLATRPKFVEDFFKDNDTKSGHLYVCVRMRSFFGFVDKLVPVIDKDLDTSWWLADDIEMAVNEALFN
jgi:hypothetical protein